MNNQTKAFSEYYWIAASGAIEQYCREHGCIYLPATFLRYFYMNENVTYLSNEEYHFLRTLGEKGKEHDVRTAMLGFESKEQYEAMQQGFIDYMKLDEAVNNELPEEPTICDFPIEIRKAIKIVKYVGEWHEGRGLNEMFEGIAEEIGRCRQLLAAYPDKARGIQCYIEICDELFEKMPIIELRSSLSADMARAKRYVESSLANMPDFNDGVKTVRDGIRFSDYSEIDCSKEMVDGFVSIYYDMGISTLTEDMMAIFKSHIDNVEQLMNLDQLGQRPKRIYRLCVANGRECITRFQLLKRTARQEQ